STRPKRCRASALQIQSVSTMLMRTLRLGLIACTLGLGQLLALPVFPGAVGFGSDTVAGRGGQVYRVTNLNDSGPGSLRYGVQEIEGPRVIVFEVSGVIELESDIIVPPRKRGNYAHLTIAGQTAPPPGITLKNAGISIQNHDVLIQHIAIRPGVSMEHPRLPRLGNRDSIKVEAPEGETTYNVVLDHVSCSWAIDETVSTWGDHGSIHDVALINSIVSEGIRNAEGGGAVTTSGYGVLGGRNTYRFSVVGNIMALVHERNPLIRDSIQNAEVVNNVIYRPHPREHSVVYFGTANPMRQDMELIASVAGNVIIRRPSGPFEGHNYSPNTYAVWVHDRAPTKMSIYLANNSVFSPDTNQWYPTDGDAWSPEVYRTGALVPKTWTSNPFPYTNVTPWMDGPEAREARLVASAGKHPAFRDAIDQSLMDRIAARTGEFV